MATTRQPKIEGDIDIVGRVYATVEKEIKRWPVNSNRASLLGDDCERRLVYWRTHWQEAALHDVGLELVFREGRLQEKEVLRLLDEAGIEVIEQQVALSWPEFQITGHIDGLIVHRNGGKVERIPLEIKSMSPFIWDSIAKEGPGVYEWEEVARAFERKPWLRKYNAQLQIYMLCHNTERAILLAKNKQSGGLAQINMRLDYDYAESLLQKAERINRHVAEGTLPEKIQWDPDVCGGCPFLEICRPDEIVEGIKILNDDELVALLEERATLEENYRRYKAVDQEVKKQFRHKEGHRFVLPGWLVTKKEDGRGITIKVERMGEDDD